MHRERKEKDKQTSLCVWQNVLACRPPLAPMVSRVEPPEKEPIRSSSFVKHTQKMMTIGTGNKSPLKQFLYPHQDEGSLRRNTFWAILCIRKIQQNETTDIISIPYNLIPWSKSEIIFLFGLSISLGLVWSNFIVFMLPCRAWLFHKLLQSGNHQVGRKEHIVVNHNLELKKIVVSNKGWFGWAGSARIPRRTDFA